MAPARSQTNSEIVPGILPLRSSWFGDVTIASAMSALVSDTRAIGLPMSITVERPTRSRTALASGSAAAAAPTDVIGTGRACAHSVVESPSNAIMRMKRPRRNRVDGPIRPACACLVISTLLPHDFTCAFVTANYFDRHRFLARRNHCHRHGVPRRRHPNARLRCANLFVVAEERRGLHARRFGHALVE